MHDSFFNTTSRPPVQTLSALSFASVYVVKLESALQLSSYRLIALFFPSYQKLFLPEARCACSHVCLTQLVRFTATLRWNFITPIARELMLLLGFVDADAWTLRQVLSSAPGRAVMLAIGGAEEALLAGPGLNDLVLNKRFALF